MTRVMTIKESMLFSSSFLSNLKKMKSLIREKYDSIPVQDMLGSFTKKIEKNVVTGEETFKFHHIREVYNMYENAKIVARGRMNELKRINITSFPNNVNSLSVIIRKNKKDMERSIYRNWPELRPDIIFGKARTDYERYNFNVSSPAKKKTLHDNVKMIGIPLYGNKFTSHIRNEKIMEKITDPILDVPMGVNGLIGYRHRRKVDLL